MHIHELKSWLDQFNAINHGETTADIRSDDRKPMFQPGHRVWYREFDPKHGHYTGHEGFYTIANVLRPERGQPFSKALKRGYCVLILKPVSAGLQHRFNPEMTGSRDGKAVVSTERKPMSQREVKRVLAKAGR